jgi:hypothetical protein
MGVQRHVVAVREADCTDDEAALTYAADTIDGHAGAEVWREARLVAYVPPPRSGRDV